MPTHDFDFTAQGRRPTAAQIVKRWRDAGRPRHFAVTYGETFAEFVYESVFGPVRWNDSGNGCRGVDRLAVVRALTDATNAALR